MHPAVFLSLFFDSFVSFFHNPWLFYIRPSAAVKWMRIVFKTVFIILSSFSGFLPLLDRAFRDGVK